MAQSSLVVYDTETRSMRRMSKIGMKCPLKAAIVHAGREEAERSDYLMKRNVWRALPSLVAPTKGNAGVLERGEYLYSIGGEVLPRLSAECWESLREVEGTRSEGSLLGI